MGRNHQNTHGDISSIYTPGFENAVNCATNQARTSTSLSTSWFVARYYLMERERECARTAYVPTGALGYISPKALPRN